MTVSLPVDALSAPIAAANIDADAERRFGGLRRLYGEADYQRLRTAHFAVVGLGGVGSWVVEALARSGVAALTLIDLDQVSESNINRQVQALGSTVGMAKAEALRLRVLDIHPGCAVTVIEEFVDEQNWPALLGESAPALDGLVDACDQIRAKACLAAWARDLRLPFVTVGAAGGKREPQLMRVEDLADTSHDPLLASLRQRLRKQYGAPKKGKFDVACVFSREPVLRPAAESVAGAKGAAAVAGLDAVTLESDEADALVCAVGDVDGSLNCHGYGSSVAVTASFGMAAAAELVKIHLKDSPKRLALNLKVALE